MNGQIVTVPILTRAAGGAGEATRRSSGPSRIGAGRLGRPAAKDGPSISRFDKLACHSV